MLKLQHTLRQYILPTRDRHRAAAHLSVALVGLMLAIALRNLDHHLTLQQEKNRLSPAYQADFGSAAQTAPPLSPFVYAARGIQPEENYHF